MRYNRVMKIRMTLWPVIVAIAIALAGCSGGGGGNTPQQAASPAPQTGLPTTAVRISADGNTFDFTAEVATTAEQQQIGMMYRSSMQPDDAMLFVFDGQTYRTFWMKNTLIPLDMLFINSDKQIVDINHNAAPQSTNTFTSSAPAKYVLEIKGGYCQEHGIDVGDMVRFDGY